MEKQIQNAIAFIKTLDVSGCITGSCLLDYFEGQDVDVFAYNEKSFTQLLFALHYNNAFQITDPLEHWKFDKFLKEENKYAKFGINTIKFTYNTCVDVNVVYKKNCTDVFSVIKSFDLNIICKGYDLQTKQELDLSGDSSTTKIADWNRWNQAYYSKEIWEVSRILRQLTRCFKYHKRGYNTDLVVSKYLELIENIERYRNIFSSENFDERLKNLRSSCSILKKICEVWLQSHEIEDKDIELINQIIKKL